jgi:beta-aspartyl-peptidase (threonine type)
MEKFTIAIHGGAGTILKEDMTPEKEKVYQQGLQESLDAAYNILKAGGSALLAVKAAVVVLEDNILFKPGEVPYSLIREYMKWMLQSWMARTQAGAVAAVRNIRNPIELALEVMQNSNHVFLMGEGANTFAAEHGIKNEPEDYFFSIQVRSVSRMRNQRICIRS